MYSTSSGQIIRPEYEECTSGRYLQLPAASLGENNDEYTSTRRIINQGQVNCLAVDDCTPKGVHHTMEGDGENSGRAENGSSKVDNNQKQPQEAQHRSIITIELNSASYTVRAGDKESPSMLDSAETINPTDILESNMEVDEDHIGMEYPYNSNLSSNNQAAIWRCGTCDFIALDRSELDFHRRTYHPAPGECGVCDFIALDPEELEIHRESFHPTAGVGHY